MQQTHYPILDQDGRFLGVLIWERPILGDTLSVAVLPAFRGLLTTDNGPEDETSVSAHVARFRLKKQVTCRVDYPHDRRAWTGWAAVYDGDPDVLNLLPEHYYQTLAEFFGTQGV